MAQKYDIAARLHADATGFVAAFGSAEAAVKRFNMAVNNTKLNTAVGNLNTFKNANMQTGTAVDTHARQLDRFNRTARGFAMAGIAGAVGFGKALVSSLKTFASYESGLTGVKKTVDGTAEDYRKLDLAFRKMSSSMPATYEEITKVAEAAGQLGVKKDGIVKFTDTMIRLGTSTNLSAEEAAMAIARISNVMGTAESDVDRFGATLVALGNNYAATESEILEMSARLAGMGSQLHMSEADVLSLAAAMSSVGIKAEMGGSAMSTVMTKMNTALHQGGQSAQAWADIMGLSADKAKAKIENDAYGALVLLLQGLNKSKDSGKNLDQVLSELGIKEIRQVDTMKRLSSAVDQVTGARKLGNQAWRENTALIDESNKRYETFASKVEMAWNRVRNIFANIGAAISGSSAGIIGSLDSILASIERVTDGFINADGTISESGKSFAATAQFVGVLTAALGIAGAAFMMFGTGGVYAVAIIAGLAAVGAAVERVYHAFSVKGKEASIEQLATLTDQTTRKTAESYINLRDKVDKSLGEMVLATGNKSKEMKSAFTKGFEGMSGYTDKEVSAMKDKVLQQLSDLSNKALQEIDKSQKRITDLGKSLMEGASNEQKKALERANQDAIRIFNEKREIVKNAEQTISKILSSAARERRALTQDEFSKLGTAFASIDKEFKTSIGNNIADLSKLQAAFDKLDKGASLNTVQNALTDLAKKSSDTVSQLTKVYHQHQEEIRKNLGDTETAKIYQENLTRAYNDQKSAILDNLKAEEDKAKALHKGVDAMKGLTEEQKRALGVSKDLTNNEKAFASISELSKHKVVSLSEAVKNAAKAKEEAAASAEKVSKKYNELKGTLDTIPEKFKAMKTSSEEAAKAVGETFVTKFKDGFEGVDVTGVGRMKVDEFVKGIRSGELTVQDAGIAAINAMRNRMGMESLTPEGRKTLETFVTGLKSVSVADAASKIGVDLKSKSKVDLGTEGKVSTETFVKGLQDGTYGIMEYGMFLTDKLKQMSKTDLSAVGAEDMNTLKGGLQSGLISVDEVTAMFAENIKAKTNVDLNPQGMETLTTLVQGLMTGKVSVDTFLTELQSIMKENSKTDLTSEGNQTGKSFGDGARNAKPNTEAAANDHKKALETAFQNSGMGASLHGFGAASNFASGILSALGITQENSTTIGTTPESILKLATDGGGGSSVGQMFNSGLFGFFDAIFGTSTSIKTNTEQTLGSSTDGKGGNQSGSMFKQGLFGWFDSIIGSAGSIKQNTQSTLGSSTDGGGGSKSGNAFKTGLGSWSSSISSTSSSIKGGTERTLGSATDGQGGSKSGQMFVTGLGNKSGAALNSGRNVANNGKSGLGSVGGSFGLGQNLAQGFINGIGSLVNQARNIAMSLASAAINAIRRIQRSASPAKETIKLGKHFSQGYYVGIEKESKYAIGSARTMAQDTLDAFNKEVATKPMNFNKVNFDAVRRNINNMRPAMTSTVSSHMTVDTTPLQRQKVDVFIHADEEWLRAEVNHGNALDDRLNYMK